MFYSQFILAKKGPLGTIWIAAHLERKLRKNQVADTDIGDSVDSIISPDIPIALRLSSHLLLGVVRIYSRKVNYLFHDCSETLLKVKQAFRSTVVDLPPEESTAPYHSITLPETFDLEDFVLPDTAVLNGNFVDHHVSTREQITLQDSVEGTELSTLQFGLDERFGDGDAPQIGLDLDEEPFLDRGLSDQNVSTTLGSEERIEMASLPEIPFTPMDTDDCHVECSEHRIVTTPKDMSMDVTNSLGKRYTTLDSNIDAGFSNMHGYNVQTPDLNEMVFGDIGAPSEVLDDMDVSYTANINASYSGPHEHAEAPSTPGLVEKAIPANVQEASILSPQGIENDIIPDEIPSQDGQKHNKLETDSQAPILSPQGIENDIILDEIPSQDGQKHNKLKIDSQAPILSPRGIENDIILDEIPSQDGQKHNKLETDSQDLSSRDLGVEMNCDPNVLKDTQNSDCSLKPCSSHLHQFDAASLEGQQLGESDPQTSKIEMPSDGRNTEESSLEKQGEGIESVTDPDTVHISSDVLPFENLTDLNKPDGLAAVVTHDAQFGSTFSASSEYPEPERMLLAPSGGHGLPDDSEQGTSDKGTRDPDRTIDRSRNLSDEKINMVEETPNLQNGSSVKVSGIARMKRKINHIPDDDDLLASILVGRGASSLKLKSTPSLPTAPFSKRSRLAAKIGATKRKVLQDDTMVLHADGIRQQLISTEDIRRTRKKAPCTCSEIWMIEKSFSEEVFGESILSGMPDELASLYYQNYDPNEIPSSGPDPSFYHSDVPKLYHPSSADKKEDLACSSEIVEKAEGADNSVISVLEKNDNLAQQSESNLQIVTQDCGTALNTIEHDDLSSVEQAVNHTEKDDVSLLINNAHTTSQDCIDGGVQNVNNDAKSSLDNVVLDKPLESTVVVEDASACIPEFPENSNSVNPDAVMNDQAMVGPSEAQLEVSFDDQIASSTFPLELGSDMKAITSPLGLSDLQDTPAFPTTGDSSGFCSATGGNVTDFLIADDDADLIEEADYDIPNTEEAQSLENSGWSVRTRGVAKYLKLLFDNESGTGREMIEMDRLLVGKTRKEASRMFFETLVLKTKDYVQVQQENSFNNINIRPTMKLQKSEF